MQEKQRSRPPKSVGHEPRYEISAFLGPGGGVFSLDGRLVDAPVLLLAQQASAENGAIQSTRLM